jgi:hypothetical protein
VSHYRGGCACGSIRYEYSGEPQLSLHCCCRSCQRASGGGHTSVFIALTEGLTTSGELKLFERTAESGNSVRGGFCPTCGSPVMSANSGYPDVRYIHIALQQSGAGRAATPPRRRTPGLAASVRALVP